MQEWTALEQGFDAVVPERAAVDAQVLELDASWVVAEVDEPVGRETERAQPRAPVCELCDGRQVWAGERERVDVGAVLRNCHCGVVGQVAPPHSEVCEVFAVGHECDDGNIGERGASLDIDLTQRRAPSCDCDDGAVLQLVAVRHIQVPQLTVRRDDFDPHAGKRESRHLEMRELRVRVDGLHRRTRSMYSSRSCGQLRPSAKSDTSVIESEE